MGRMGHMGYLGCLGRVGRASYLCGFARSMITILSGQSHDVEGSKGRIHKETKQCLLEWTCGCTSASNAVKSSRCGTCSS